ncbi:unnamed protein product [Orchesella dallaii]|uniref:COP9 signalosome complex subunit 8 n=1 Tax=Orchesella dallaii TaxID=48710 RepID=A0ABP1Q9N5_9HEXA
METAIITLEQRELENGPDGIRVEGYTELLTYYLLQDELCNAKFLWKRVPSNMKQNAEIDAVWNVGKRLWTKDMPGFYEAASAFQWSAPIAPIMNQLKETVREKTIRLIGRAYSSIKPQDIATMLGITLPEVETLVNSRAWKVVDGMIEPTECVSEDVPISSSEEQIGKLTDYVAFLEN